MKKAIIFTALIASLGGSLSAQDTLWQKPAPLSNYYYNNWIDTTGGCGLYFPADRARVIAKQFLTSDTLQIYGIAAIMMNFEEYVYYYVETLGYPTFQDYLNHFLPEEPSLENCEESLLLYQYHGGSSPVMQQLGDSLRVHRLYTPVTHWMLSNTPPLSFSDTVPKPVYERYFSTPQYVSDTFYVGFTRNDFKMAEIIIVDEEEGNDTTIGWQSVRPGLLVCRCSPIPSMELGYRENLAFLWPSRDLEESTHTWDFSRWEPMYSLYLFPILTPGKPIDTTSSPVDTTVTPIDTTVTPIDTVTPGGDTTGVQRADLVSRYVSVLPNPAHERAEVLSSFGLTLIELYDEQGRLLRTLPATGLRATLDLHSLPPATYLLRIHTPAGKCTKKLIVR